MPKIFQFCGPRVTLGSHGLVNSGDTLVLTDKESADIKSDRRFKSSPNIKPQAGQMADAIQLEVSQLTMEELKQEAARLNVEAPCWIGKQTLMDRIHEAKTAQEAETKTE